MKGLKEFQSSCLGTVGSMLGHAHTAHMQHPCRRVEELRKEKTGEEVTGWESTALHVLVDTYLTVFLTQQFSTVHRATRVNVKSIVLSGKNKNEMHKLIFP